MKKAFYRNSPVILGAAGALFAAADSMIDRHLPERFDNLHGVFNAVIFFIAGAVVGGIIQRLYKYSMTDVLTGVKNRGYFYLRLNHEMKRVGRKKNDLSLLMIDIDNFKTVNDTYGHIVGDKVLKQISSIFRKIVGQNELICRWGGEEFAILLPRANAESAYKTADRIRREIEECSFCSPLTKGRVTISIGAATISLPMEEDAFVKIADNALYKAKEKKNIVVCSNEASSSKECRVINL